MEGLDQEGWEIIVSPKCDTKKRKIIDKLTKELLKNSHDMNSN